MIGIPKNPFEEPRARKDDDVGLARLLLGEEAAKEMARVSDTPKRKQKEEDWSRVGEDLTVTDEERKRSQREAEERIGIPLAKEIFQEDYLGPEAVKKTFGIDLELHEIPRIPFSKEDMERARELGQYLILRVDKAPDGESLTMEKMEELLEEKLEEERKGNILFDTSWYKDEPFFNQETPKLAWNLASKKVLHDSENKNYLDQNQLLVDYLTEEVFKGKNPPKPYEDAIKQFEAKKKDLKELMTDNWQEAARELSELELTELLRPTASEVLYDLLMNLQVKGERHFESDYIWTRSCRSVGGLVSVGYLQLSGTGVRCWYPDDARVNLGVAPVRSL